MINNFFAKLTVLIITILLTGGAAALGSAVSSALKGVVNNVLRSDQSAKTNPNPITTQSAVNNHNQSQNSVRSKTNSTC